MIVVLDTNIVASATYWRGKPAHCLEALPLNRVGNTAILIVSDFLKELGVPQNPT